MSVVVAADGTVTQLDGRAEPDETVSEEDVKDAGKLARLLGKLLKELAALRRRWAPREMVFEDLGTDGSGTTKIRLNHNFGGHVLYWPVRCKDYGAGGPGLEHHADTDADTLVLVAYGVGTVSVLVRERG